MSPVSRWPPPRMPAWSLRSSSRADRNRLALVSDLRAATGARNLVPFGPTRSRSAIIPTRVVVERPPNVPPVVARVPAARDEGLTLDGAEIADPPRIVGVAGRGAPGAPRGAGSQPRAPMLVRPEIAYDVEELVSWADGARARVRARGRLWLAWPRCVLRPVHARERPCGSPPCSSRLWTTGEGLWRESHGRRGGGDHADPRSRRRASDGDGGPRCRPDRGRARGAVPSPDGLRPGARGATRGRLPPRGRHREGPLRRGTRRSTGTSATVSTSPTTPRDEPGGRHPALPRGAAGAPWRRRRSRGHHRSDRSRP